MCKKLNVFILQETRNNTRESEAMFEKMKKHAEFILMPDIVDVVKNNIVVDDEALQLLNNAKTRTDERVARFKMFADKVRNIVASDCVIFEKNATTFGQSEFAQLYRYAESENIPLYAYEDKTQVINVSEDKIQYLCAELAIMVQKLKIDILCPVMGSGMEVASRIAKKVHVSIVPLYGFTRDSSANEKEDGIKEFVNRFAEPHFHEKRIAIVEDIIDSGRTIEQIRSHLAKYEMSDILIMSMMMRADLEILKTPNKLIVPNSGVYDKHADVYWKYTWERFHELKVDETNVY